ncbi:Glyoxalase/Bleomycin resistance protein/Dihydroxybiphenyl dioxygenase [Dactylonectria macrodidyma]|uniref:Glyoxalase/Bleomycin resistance protein/Dihydroxybiphenyl dioxygenase n=1 Tax=Dactylonectria macrodidyma TaxID=307937 RepID=A0A9P9DBQ8_9HYPO|nr:Glyoxalase/Bleomycin resistance protein/Dihydroxybiphenyl dioxygenase [Dactylonectria macrodidyma]
MVSPPKRISLKSLMYVWYSHVDIDTARRFLVDFGLIPTKTTPDKTWYRGFGESPVCYITEKSKNGKSAFFGGGWAVDEYADLEAAAQVPGASPITDAEEIIGGKTVSVKDPASGTIHLHWGYNERKIEQAEEPKKLVYNTWDTKLRKGEFQRFEDGPSHVHKLGHYGYEVNHSKFEKVRQWYFDTFTLTATDSLFNPETGKDIMTFCHLDKGEQYVDHHNFFISAGESTDCIAHHASFEVDDFDSELKGHNFLAKRGWSLVWGVGRHLLGSQIFDYWFDNEGFVLEHYADGDLVNCNNPHQREPASPDSISIWGPNVPLAFLTRRQEDMGKFLPPPGAGGPPGPPAAVTSG